MIKTERLKSVHSKKSPETRFFKYSFILLIFLLSIGSTHGFAENISGHVYTSSGSGIDGVTITFSNGEESTETNSSGYYKEKIKKGWSGTATPSKVGYSFSPASRSYSKVTSDQSNQDYTENEEDTLLSITTNIVGSGNVEIDPDKDYYAKGSLITMTATANSGWLFSEWSGELDSPDNPERISINSDMTITAVFLADDDTDGVGNGDINYGCFIGGLLFQ
ncbi:MAG: InlB B-repeat-containing protein [Nitrospinales bacterium]